jgi:type II secretory pathway component PulF
MATEPVNFLIRIVLPKAFQLQEAICLDNGKTNERFQTEMEEADPDLEEWEEVVLQVSRYPHAEKNLIVGKEIGEKTIILSDELKIVAI